MFDTNPYKNIFGLDISNFYLRLAQLKKTGKEIYIYSLNEVVIPEGVVFDGDIKDQAKLRNSLTKLIRNAEGKKISTPFVNCVLPEKKTFIKLIQLPEAKTADLNEAIKWEASQHIPMDLEEMYLDWQIIPGKNQTGKGPKVLIAAAPKILVDSYTQLLESIKLTPVSFETESTAVIRSLALDSASSPQLIIDLGGGHTNLIVFDKNSIQFSSTLPFSGKDLTQQIAHQLNMSFADAEKAKIICGLETKKGKGQVKKILIPNFLQLVEKIHEVENFYLNLFPDSQKFKKVILTGSGALLKNLDDFLQKKLNLPLEKSNPLRHVNPKKSKITLIPEQACSFSTTIGLALKNLI